MAARRTGVALYPKAGGRGLPAYPGIGGGRRSTLRGVAWIGTIVPAATAATGHLPIPAAAPTARPGSALSEAVAPGGSRRARRPPAVPASRATRPQAARPGSTTSPDRWVSWTRRRRPRSSDPLTDRPDELPEAQVPGPNARHPASIVRADDEEAGAGGRSSSASDWSPAPGMRAAAAALSSRQSRRISPTGIHGSSTPVPAEAMTRRINRAEIAAVGDASRATISGMPERTGASKQGRPDAPE